MGQDKKNYPYKLKIIFAVLAGLFYIGPYILTSYLVFTFLLPILYCLYKEYNLKNVELVSFSFFLSIIALSPVIVYNAFAYLIGIITTFLFLSFFLVIIKKLIRVFSYNFFSVFIPAVVWSSLLLLFNYKSLGKAVFDVGVLMPLKAPIIWYVGSIGLTTLAVLFNSALAHCLARKNLSSLAAWVFILFILFASHIFLITSKPLESYAAEGPSLRLALIQGDIPSKTMFGYKEDLDERIKRYIDLSEKADSEKKVTITIWPEYTLPIDVMNRFPEKMEPITLEIKRSGHAFVIGSMCTEPIDQTGGRYNYNAALIFKKDGTLGNIYYSQEPAIFNRNIRPKANKKELYLDNFGITLCWEEINDEIFRNYVKSGAEYFISLSSNTDLDYSCFKQYASYFSRARAAENMRYLARATQTGITQIIDPYGRVAEKIPQDKATYLIGEIVKINAKTFYSIYGGILTKAFLLIMVFIGVVSRLVKKRVRNNG